MPNSDIKAIETLYNGYRFRSRLEARYAVLFDYAEIPYVYEKEGFELEGGRYLPDFWLPRQKKWLEIKGTYPNQNEIDKMIQLCRFTQRSLICAVGDLGNEDKHIVFDYEFLHPDDIEEMRASPDEYEGLENVEKIISRGFRIIWFPNAAVFEVISRLAMDARQQDLIVKVMRSARFEHGESGF